MLVALGLRLYHLGAQSFWIDEISVTSFVRSGHLLSDLRDRGGPFEPPLHYLAVLAALHLPFGFETAARVPSAVFGALEVLALVLLTREATGRRGTALLAGSLLAVAPFVVRYGQENRYYVMFSALHLLSWWLLLRAVRLRRTAAWLAYGAAAAAMQLTHPFAPLVLLLQAALVAAVAWRDRRREPVRPLWRGYGAAVLLGLALILPWYVYGAQRWIPDARRGKSYALNVPGIKVRLEPELFKRGAEWLLGNSSHLTPLVVLLVAAALGAPLLASGRGRVVAAAVLVYSVGMTFALARLASVLGTYFAYRRVESLVAPMLLLAALAVVGGVDCLRAARIDARLAYGAGAVVAIALIVLSLVATFDYYGTEKTNYRAFARIVRDTPRDATVVVGPVDHRWVPLIPQYLRWQGVRRGVTFLVAYVPPPAVPFRPGGARWLTGSPPQQRALRTRALNDLDRMQVLAGDRSMSQVILPWFASSSHPRTPGELAGQRDAVATRPPSLPAPP